MDNNKVTFTGILELVEDQFNTSTAEISLNPNFSWAKVIITDDKPNANRERIPAEEFPNLIRTGVHAPLKMQRGKISDGHDEAFGNPIGVFTHLSITPQNQVVALAALWPSEREEDILLLKEMKSAGKNPEVSWEISYTNTVDHNTYVDLTGVSLNGAAIVNRPAYAGRTPILSIASDKEDALDEIQELREKLEDKETKLKDAEATIEQLKADAEVLNTELETLRQYKADAEEAQARVAKLAEIREKFSQAELEKDDEYFKTNEELLLALSNDALEFMIQEMVSFSKKTETVASETIPNLKGTSTDTELSPRELGAELRKHLLKN